MEDKPENPDWHPEDVKAAVRKTGITLTQLSIKAGYQPKSFQSVLKRQWPRVEAIIAKHIRRQPWSIWPSRYDGQHKPLTRPCLRRRHIKNGIAANTNDGSAP